MDISDQNIIPFPYLAKAEDQATAENLRRQLERINALNARIADLKSNPVLNRTERNAITSLLYFAAQDTSFSLTEIGEQLQKKFGARDVGEIRSRDYDAVVQFLLGMKAQESSHGIGQ